MHKKTCIETAQHTLSFIFLLNFPYLTSHVARHIFACTILLGEGIPKEVIQVMMRHHMDRHIFNTVTATEVNTRKRSENLTVLISE